jgi:hypothetical protein
VRPPPGDDGSGRVLVRPPALIEAAAGVRAAARVVEQCATALAHTVGGCVVFGDAQEAYRTWAAAWAGELTLLARETALLSTRVEATAADYLRTDARAMGPG